MNTDTRREIIFGALLIFLGGMLTAMTLFQALYGTGATNWLYWIMSPLWLIFAVANTVTLYYNVSTAISKVRIEEIDRHINTLNEIQEALR